MQIQCNFKQDTWTSANFDIHGGAAWNQCPVDSKGQLYLKKLSTKKVNKTVFFHVRKKQKYKQLSTYFLREKRESGQMIKYVKLKQVFLWHSIVYKTKFFNSQI